MSGGNQECTERRLRNRDGNPLRINIWGKVLLPCPRKSWANFPPRALPAWMYGKKPWVLLLLEGWCNEGLHPGWCQQGCHHSFIETLLHKPHEGDLVVGVIWTVDFCFHVLAEPPREKGRCSACHHVWESSNNVSTQHFCNVATGAGSLHCRTDTIYILCPS